MKPYVWNGERCWRVGDIAKYLGVNIGSVSYLADKNKDLIKGEDYNTVDAKTFKSHNGFPRELDKAKSRVKVCSDRYKDYVLSEYKKNETTLESSIQKIKVVNRTPIEILLQVDEEGMTTAKKLYEFLGLNPTQYSRWTKMNITENEFAEEGIDFKLLDMNVERNFNPNPTTDYRITASFAKKLCMTSKSERGEQARNYFIKVEENLKKASEIYQVKQQQPTTTNEHLQIAQQLINAISGVSQELGEVKQELGQAKQEVVSIKNIFATNEESHREFWIKSLRKIGKSIGDYQRAFCESYDLLEKKAHCSLPTRLKNKQERMLMNGATKTQISNTNYMDVIEDDPRLSEIYTNIIKEMYCKYC